MKEEFMKSQTEGYFDDMNDAEYKDWLHSQEPATQKHKESEHDAWWNSLTNEQKEELFKSQEEVFKLSIEEMNYHDNLERMIGFGL